jgi:hypothetical protein
MYLQSRLAQLRVDKIRFSYPTQLPKVLPCDAAFAPTATYIPQHLECIVYLRKKFDEEEDRGVTRAHACPHHLAHAQ